MKFSEAFRETAFRFNLKGSHLAEKSGMTSAQISRFRRGQINMTVESLEKLLDALPPEARTYMLELVIKDELFLPRQRP